MKPVVKGSNRKWLAPLLLGTVCALAAALTLCPLFSRFVVSDYRTGRVFLTLPVKEGETFALRFTHSVNLSDVTDTIEWTGGQLVCRSTHFTAYGAGIPVLSEGVGTGFEANEDGFTITGINKPEERILILLQTVPNHRLIYRDRDISLLALGGSGTLLALEVKRVPLYRLF